MNFLVDAQLPRRLALELAAVGHDAVHTLDLPAANRTTDQDIVALATQEDRVVVTKDNDFVVSFHLRGAPPKLLLVSTGNLSNQELSRLFAANVARLEEAFRQHVFVELSVTAITIHA